MKKQSNLSRLLQIAGNHNYLLYASWVLSAISALVALVPFYYIWKIIQEVLEVAPDFSYAQNLTHNGWMAVLFAAIAVLIYIGGLMCSHKGAFRIAANLRLQTMKHIVKLPLGFAEQFGSGRLRKIVNESSAATETYLAHQLPDRANAIATPCGLLALLLIFDWRLGLLSLVPVVLGFLIMMAMTGKRMQEKMKEYQNALDDMSNEAVEYVRGIPVVKTFGQTIFSFKKFKDSIDRYKVWVIAYTKELRIGGVNVKNIPKEELMNTVSFVFQNSRLIKASILENVRMGKPNATREEIMAALHNAQCGDILEKLPQGADTVIGTTGVYLSGGEQQRIAIARVMLKDSPIIILDEATAFADPDNETRVQAAFSKLSEGKTVIMIAHRLSTVAGADQIYVIENGRIAENGNSQELLEKGGIFSRMWQDYQTSIQWKVAKSS